MKVTSFRDVETYIYSSVIIPLKQLNIPDLQFPSPIRGENGEDWQFSVRSQPINRDYRRNYQRTQAMRRANQQVMLFAEGREYVVAMYHPRQKWVKIYKRPFHSLKAVPLMGKLYEAFYTNSPFGKIMHELEAPRERRFRARGYRGRLQEPMEAYDDDMVGYSEGDI